MGRVHFKKTDNRLSGVACAHNDYPFIFLHQIYIKEEDFIFSLSRVCHTAGMSLKDIPTFERPREKLIAKGPAALRTEELLAILLRTGMQGKNAIEVARSIVQRYEGTSLLGASYAELRNLAGVGSTKAVQIIAALELGRRLQAPAAAREIYLETPEDAARAVAHISEHKKEHFVALYLDARNRLIHMETVSIGTLNASLVHPREVFEPAIRHCAAQVIVAHNHPSGDPEPSAEDVALTRRLADAGALLGITLLDHVVVAGERWRRVES